MFPFNIREFISYKEKPLTGSFNNRICFRNTFDSTLKSPQYKPKKAKSIGKNILGPIIITEIFGTNGK